MNTQRARPNREASVWVVASSAEQTEELARSLGRGGVAVEATQRLEEALAAGPAVVVVDPTGWERACRWTLEAFESRPHPPPAVLFTASDPHVVHTAGPAYAFFLQGSPPRRVAAAAIRARGAWEKFSRLWPRPLADLPLTDVRRIKAALEASTGLEIRSDREPAFLQAVRCRMVARLTPTAADYAGFLASVGEASGETELLAGLLSVGETYFWRYAGQFRALQNELLPSLTRGPGRETGRLRIWSAGCASGEEPYSLAIACLEALGNGWDVEVVGTDIHRPSLCRAESGVYTDRTLRNLPSHLRSEYLEPVPGGARVTQALRRRVRFELLNLGGEEVESWVERQGPFDAVFCRNTLIYFSRPAVDKLIDTFEAALAEGGGLFLGASETVFPCRPTLEPVRSTGCFFYRKAKGRVPITAAPEPVRGADPEEPQVARLYEAGLALLDSEDFEGADRRFRQIVELSPDDARGHTGMALLLANQGREAEAADRLGQAMNTRPVLAEARYVQGLIAQRRGSDGAALGHYREALDVDPNFFMAHVNRAWILRRLGRREGFLEEMRAASKILSSRPQVSRWATGGVGLEALLCLVAEALESAGDRR